LVDGTDLSGVASVADPLSVGGGAIDHQPTNDAAPQPASRGGALPLLFLGAGALVVLLLLGVGFVIVAGVASTSGSDEQVPVAAPEPPPAPEPEPEPEPEPAPAPVQMLVIGSSPGGAEVWEGDAQLCTTPCATPHPDHAPLPRSFVLKLAGHVDTPYDATTVEGPHQITLPPVKAAPRPQAPKPGNTRGPKINIER
jgi:hypothetical protein